MSRKRFLETVQPPLDALWAIVGAFYTATTIDIGTVYPGSRGHGRKLTVLALYEALQLNGVAEIAPPLAFVLSPMGAASPRCHRARLGHVTWLKNRTATRALDDNTYFKAMYGHPPNLSDL
jgi:hypothetical protein